MQISSAILSITSNLILVLYFEFNIIGIALANLIALIIPALFAIYEYLKRKANLTITASIRAGLYKIDFELIKKYIYSGAPFIPGMIFAWVLSSCDKIILSRYCSMHEVGIYSLTDSLGQLFYLLILQPLSGSYLPELFESFAKNKNNLLFIEQKNRKIMWASMMGIFLVITFGFFVAKKILNFVLPPQYLQVTNYLWPLLIGYIFLMGTYFSCSIIQFKKKTKFLSLSFCIPATLNIFLNLLLVPKFGAYGAVSSTTFSYAIYFAVTIYYGNKVLTESNYITHDRVELSTK